MNCECFREQWSDWHDGRGGVDTDAMDRHRAGCTDCARYDREMRALLDGLASLPLPAAGRRSPAPAGAPRWQALAATLVLGIVLGAFWSGRDDAAAGPEAAPVDLASTGEQRIAIAIESPRRYERVEFVVELPDGVELEGFPGQHRVRWTGSLAEGRSRLRLPLRISDDAHGGDLVARIRHDGGERRLVVPLSDGSAASGATGKSA